MLLKDHLLHLLWVGDLPLNQIAPSPIQRYPEHFQGWDTSMGRKLLCSSPPAQEFPPGIQTKPALFQCSRYPLSCHSLQALKGCSKVTQSFLLFRLNNYSSQAFLTGEVFSPLVTFVAPPIAIKVWVIFIQVLINF